MIRFIWRCAVNFVILCFVLTAPGTLAAPTKATRQSAKPAPVKAPAKPPVRKVVPKPDPIARLARALRANSVAAGDDLYTACLISDFRELARSLSPLRGLLDQPKGEFETTAQYEERQAGWAAAMKNGRRALVCMPVSDRDLGFDYDADRGSFFGAASLWMEPDLDFKQTGKYVSSTRMGVKATVTSYLEVCYRAEFAKLTTSPACVNYGRIGLAVAVPIERAPAFKKNAYLAMVGEIVAPYIEYSETAGEPTIDHPKDIMTITLSVPMKLEDVAIVDSAGTHFHCHIDD